MSAPDPTGSEWQVTSVPRAWHNAHPKTMRPPLKFFWDIFAISLLLLILGSGVVVASVMLGRMIFPGAGATLLSLGVSVVFIAATWFLLSRSILYWGTPFSLGLAAVAWGVTAGVALGGFTSSTHLSELAVGWGVPEISWSLAGAWPEETAKALGVVLLLFAGRTWWNRPWHGLIAGMLVGIGFEAFENALYASAFASLHAESDISGALEMWGLRIVAGPLLHALCTGLVGYAIGIALLRGGLSSQQRIGWACGGWAAGFSVHALWNLAPNWEVDIPLLSLVRMVLVWGTGATVLVIAFIHCSREARVAADAWLYPVVTIYQKKTPTLVPGVSGALPGAGGAPGFPGASGFPSALGTPGVPGPPTVPWVSAGAPSSMGHPLSPAPGYLPGAPGSTPTTAPDAPWTPGTPWHPTHTGYPPNQGHEPPKHPRHLPGLPNYPLFPGEDPRNQGDSGTPDAGGPPPAPPQH